ncbi:MAG: hypothetical protein RI897_2971 [Verrucomicrobiota bacterium]|jgi:hypothetical protein
MVALRQSVSVRVRGSLRMAFMGDWGDGLGAWHGWGRGAKREALRALAASAERKVLSGKCCLSFEAQRAKEEGLRALAARGRAAGRG